MNSLLLSDLSNLFSAESTAALKRKDFEEADRLHDIADELFDGATRMMRAEGDDGPETLQ